MLFSQNKQGFSLAQLIVVMTILIILLLATFLWIDPLARIGEAKNSKRIQHVNGLALAMFDYAAKHEGNLPILGSVTTAKKVLCSTQSGSNLSCAGDSQLCLRIDDDDFYKYISELPFDPDKSSSADTGYYLQKDANNSLVLGSCTSYNSEVITNTPAIKIACGVYGGGHCWYEGASDITCSAVCSALNLDCINNAMYGPDKNSGGTALCQLALDLGKTCGTCTVAATSTPPWFDGGTACAIPTGAVSCATLSGNKPICACN